MTNDIQTLIEDICEWSDDTFSEGIFCTDRAKPLAYHLKKEVDELIIELEKGGNNPDFEQEKKCLEEYADCFILLLDSAIHFGISLDKLIEASKEKLEINKRRLWGNPDKNGVIEHIS